MQETLKNFGVQQWGGGGPSIQIPETDQRLCDACRTGNFEGAKKALEDGADPSVQFRLALGEITPIFLCAARGYIDIGELLIQYKANINRKMDFDGTICLHHAASNERPDMCKFLIEHGCEVNQRDKLGRTPLMDAAEIGSIDVISVLIAEAADVNAEDREHHSALSYCIDFVSAKEPKFFQAAVVLVDNGANPNYAGKFANRTLLHCASAQGETELVKKLVEQHAASFMVYDNEGKLPIKYAMENNHQAIVDYLQQQMQAQQQVCCTIL